MSDYFTLYVASLPLYCVTLTGLGSQTGATSMVKYYLPYDGYRNALSEQVYVLRFLSWLYANGRLPYAGLDELRVGHLERVWGGATCTSSSNGQRTAIV